MSLLELYGLAAYGDFIAAMVLVCLILDLLANIKIDVTAYAPGSAVQWGSYEVCKGYLFRMLSWLESQKHIPNHIPGKETYVNAFSAGIVY